jgi:hypothetical protein
MTSKRQFCWRIVVVIFSARPARVVKEIDVNAVIPVQDRRNNKADMQKFFSLRNEILEIIRAELPTNYGGDLTWGVDFVDKKVLITGANRGIGYGLAEGVSQGWGQTVTIVALEEDVTEIAEQFSESYKRQVQGISCDIAELDQVDLMADQVGQVDVLVNNAGFEYITPITDPSKRTDEVFRRIIEINVIGTFSVTRRLLDKIPDGGRIVNTASMWGQNCGGRIQRLLCIKARCHWPDAVAVTGIGITSNFGKCCVSWMGTHRGLDAIPFVHGGTTATSRIRHAG